jgi:hypothetical protein
LREWRRSRLGKKEASVFFEIGFFEDGTKIEQSRAAREGGGTTGGGRFIFNAMTK